LSEKQDHLDFLLAKLNPSKNGLRMQQDFMRFGVAKVPRNFKEITLLE